MGRNPRPVAAAILVFLLSSPPTNAASPVGTGARPLVSAVALRTFASNLDAPSNFTRVGPLEYFTANDQLHGDELWATNRTTGTTSLVDDIMPGSRSSEPMDLTPDGSKLYFLASGSGAHPFGLWRTDGTATGTSFVAPAWTESPPPVVLAGRVLFSQDAQLWAAGSTSSAAGMLQPAAGPSHDQLYPEYLTAFDGEIVFAGEDAAGATQLWKTDGTSAGTARLSNVDDTPGGGLDPRDLTVVGAGPNGGGTLFFAGSDPDHGSELWAMHNLTGPPAMVRDIRSGLDGSAPEFLTALGGRLLFQATDAHHGRQLWTSNGTVSGTTRLTGRYASLGGPAPAYLTSVAGHVFFTGVDPTGSTRLYELSRSATGFVIAQVPGYLDVYPPLTACGPFLLFSSSVAGLDWADAAAGTHGILRIKRADGFTPAPSVAAGCDITPTSGQTEASCEAQPGNPDCRAVWWVPAVDSQGGSAVYLAQPGSARLVPAPGFRYAGGTSATLRLSLVNAPTAIPVTATSVRVVIAATAGAWAKTLTATAGPCSFRRIAPVRFISGSCASVTPGTRQTLTARLGLRGLPPGRAVTVTTSVAWTDPQGRGQTAVMARLVVHKPRG